MKHKFTRSRVLRGSSIDWSMMNTSDIVQQIKMTLLNEIINEIGVKFAKIWRFQVDFCFDEISTAHGDPALHLEAVVNSSSAEERLDFYEVKAFMELTQVLEPRPGFELKAINEHLTPFSLAQFDTPRKRPRRDRYDEDTFAEDPPAKIVRMKNDSNSILEGCYLPSKNLVIIYYARSNRHAQAN